MEFNLATMWPVGNPGVIKSWAVLFGPCWNGAVKLSNNISLVSNNISLVFSTQHKAWLWGFLSFTSVPHSGSASPWRIVWCAFIPPCSAATPAWGRSRWMSQGKCCSPGEDFTLCVLPWGAAPASLAGWDEFKLLVLHGSWASRTRVKYGMRLPGKPENPPPAWSTAQTSWALHFSGIKWTKRVENCVLLCCFGCKKKNPKTQNTTMVGFMNYGEEKIKK